MSELIGGEGRVKPDDLLQAVNACAKESEGCTRSKVCFSDNWFKMRRWEKGLVQIQADRENAREAEAKSRATLCAATSPTGRSGI